MECPRIVHLIRFVFFCAAALVWTDGAEALVNHDEDTARSAVAPSAALGSLGWQFVGPLGSVTAVYIDNGWVLTAGHVAIGEVTFEGVKYAAVPDSRIRLSDPEGGLSPDIVAYRIHPKPDLGKLEIRESAPKVGEPVVMVGCGRDRGEAISWRGISGFSLTSKRMKRWGSNRIEEVGRYYSTQYTRTRGFGMSFDPFDTRYEAQAVNGDSGGAVFTKRGNRWELAGLLFTILAFADQPEATSLYGNRSFAVDLSHYREQILELIRSDGPLIQRESETGSGEALSPESNAVN